MQLRQKTEKSVHEGNAKVVRRKIISAADLIDVLQESAGRSV